MLQIIIGDFNELVLCFRGKDGLVRAVDSGGTIGDPRGLTAIMDFLVKIFKLTKYVGTRLILHSRNCLKK